MSEMKNKCFSFCYSCERKTNHEILAEHSYSTAPDNYRMEFYYQIVRCMGCSNHGFRLLEVDSESYISCYSHNEYLTEEDFTTEKIYPKPINLKFNSWDLPEPVRKIYSETLLAIQEEVNILATIGLRATLEAICQDKKLNGHNLDKKIEQLFDIGLITERDANFLHSVRFLGNDAVHEIIQAEKYQIQAALKIIEYLIESLYILEKEIAGKLPNLYDKFIDKLKQKIENLDGEFSLFNLFSEEGIFKKQLPEFNNRIKDDIQNGKINFIQLSNDKNLPFEKVKKTT